MPPVRPGLARGSLRGARAAVFALAALLLAATAHLGGGGTLPSVPALVLLIVPLAWGAVALAGRRRGRTSLLAALGGAQLGLHEAFMTLGGASCTGAAPTTGMHAMPGMAAAGGAPVCPAPGMAGMSAHAAGTPAVMFAGHVLATIATALLLAHGERLLATLPEMLVARLTRWVVGAVVPILPRPAARPGTSARRTWDDVVTGSVQRRGPPSRPGVAVPA